MKILVVNTFHYIRGGDCRHAIGLAQLLKKAGHEVYHFGMKGNKNIDCSEEAYFINEIDYREALKSRNPISALNVIWHSIYSVEAKKNIGMLIDRIHPDIVHLHSIRHHLTKSILPEINKRKIPIVWTLHDYKEICPNTSFYDGRGICEKCKGRKYSNVIWNKCKKGSFPASIITYLESVINGQKRYDNYIQKYISPSSFLRDKFIEYGYDPDKVVNIPNFITLDDFKPRYEYDNYLLYLGRLEKEKGLITLVKAFSLITKKFPEISLKIAGTGSLTDELVNLISRMKISNVELLGFIQGSKLEAITKNAKAIVIPSEWYENYPFSCLEAMAYGKPVIASDIGGMPEQIKDGITGFLFEPFNEEQLALKIKTLSNMKREEIVAMGKNARAMVEKINSPKKYLDDILGIYGRLIKQ